MKLMILAILILLVPSAMAVETTFGVPSTVTIKETETPTQAPPQTGGSSVSGGKDLNFYFYTYLEYERGFLDTVVYLKNEGIYIDDEMEISLKIYHGLPSIPFAGFFEKFFTAIPKTGEMTKINIRKKIDLTDGNYVLKTQLTYVGDKANTYNRTSETVFTVKRELSLIPETIYDEISWDGKTLITEIIDFIKSIIQKIYNLFSFI